MVAKASCHKGDLHQSSAMGLQPSELSMVRRVGLGRGLGLGLGWHPNPDPPPSTLHSNPNPNPHLHQVSGLEAVLGFLTEEVSTWRSRPSTPTSPMRASRASDADADADGLRGGGPGAGTSASHRLSIAERVETAAAAAQA